MFCLISSFFGLDAQICPLSIKGMDLVYSSICKQNTSPYKNKDVRNDPLILTCILCLLIIKYHYFLATWHACFSKCLLPRWGVRILLRAILLFVLFWLGPGFCALIIVYNNGGLPFFFLTKLTTFLTLASTVCAQAKAGDFWYNQKCYKLIATVIAFWIVWKHALHYSNIFF